MQDLLPFRSVGSAPRAFAAPIASEASGPLLLAGRARIYIALAETRIDEWILRASLARANLPVYGFAPAGRGLPVNEVRARFLEGTPVMVPLAAPRIGSDRLARLLALALESGTEVDLCPVEVLWAPRGPTPSLWNLLLGNPYNPPRPTRWLRLLLGGRVRVLLGAPGALSELAAASRCSGDALALAGYVRGQAVKALSLAQRRALGERYKAPRLIVEHLQRESGFADAVAAAGSSAGLTREESLARAEDALRELATGHNGLSMEVFARFARWLYTRVYEPEIRVDRAELEKLRELGKQSSLLFVPSHKSNFDHLILYQLLYAAGFPPPHTAAGNNMEFFPLGRILRGTGAYFIRRSFQDDPVYKEAFGAFIHYLVQRRFHQEFFIEGGRTRSGKLLPPRFGMLRYIVDACRQSDVDDARVVPTAISYDQVLEVDDYARELQGGDKERESFAFLVRMIRRLRSRDLGRVYVAFGEPIPIRDALAQSADPRLEVEKLAFRIANEINARTRLTAVASVCSALLGAGNRALTTRELDDEIALTIDFARERGVALDPDLLRGASAGSEAGRRALLRARIARSYSDGALEVFWVPESARHAASFYRNTVLHFFLIRAIARLSRLAAAQGGRAQDWALRLRELLKFEFFFRDRVEFGREVEREEAALARLERTGATPLLAASPCMLVDYFESYLVVAETLTSLPVVSHSERQLLARCHAVGQRLLLQRRVYARELLSNANFGNALRLAVNLGALHRSGDDLALANRELLDKLARDLALLARLARQPG